MISDFSLLFIFIGVQEGVAVSDVRFRIYKKVSLTGEDYSHFKYFLGVFLWLLRSLEGAGVGFQIWHMSCNLYFKSFYEINISEMANPKSEIKNSIIFAPKWLSNNFMIRV